ncbi:MAG: dihydropteroate synthase, partial [Thermoplasmata archaeon]|nr:dihydropteroate synthase [Thermoplasmata archaeon]
MRVRVRTFRDIEEAKKQIADLGVEPVSIEMMAPKALHFNLLVENVRPPVAIIIKESMLAVGADAAIHRNAITGKIEKCDVLVMATRKHLRKASTSLRMQPFGINELAVEMMQAADNFFATPQLWKLPNGSEFDFERTKIMGVLNVTPDSFSGDGIVDDFQNALKRAIQIQEEGADLIDIGGESTRPSAPSIDEKVEIERVIPIIKAMREIVKIPISIDTRKPKVAEAAIEAGASVVNDVGGLLDREMIKLCAREKVPVIAMHMKGTPENMQIDPHYDDVVGEVMQHLANRVEDAVEAGIERSQIAIDPGIGFGKRLEDNLELIRRIGEFKTLGQPIAIGTSRKSFIGKITGQPVDHRLEGSIGAASVAVWNGADIIRCHDVRETKLAMQLVD